MKKWFPFGLALALLLLAQPVWSFDLTLLHVNDSHSYLDATSDKLKPGGESTYVKLGAWARLKTAVDAVRSEKKNVVLLHAGDVVQGDLYFMKYGGRPEMEFLDRLGFDAMTLGNHEFDKGPDFLADFLDYARVPVLGANVDAVGIPKLAARVKPYCIFSYGEEKVGVIGLTTGDTARISKSGPGVSFGDEAEAARKYVRELEAQGINKIVLLTHVGLDRDKELAAVVPGVDVIVGGHSHTLLGDAATMNTMGKTVEGPYPVVVKGADGNDVYVVTAWKWSRVLGHLDVIFDDEGHVIAARGKPIMLLADDFKRKNEAGDKIELTGAARKAVLKDIADNPMTEVVAESTESVAFLKPYNKGVEGMRQDVIGVATGPLPHIRVPGVTDSGVPLPHGSLMAPIVCQSMLDKVDSTGESVTIAFMNAGGVRVGLEQGNITVGSAYVLLPFNNTLHVLRITGRQIRVALEHGVTIGDGAFPCVAGARYTADMTRPEGSRVTRVDVLGRDGKWESLDAAKKYNMVVSAFLASGGDGYEVLKQVADRYDTGFGDVQAFIEYVKKRKDIAPPKSTGVTYIPAR
ncbi:MAG: 5'-nucleotidase C-terminal domain-containing protein [Pseudodesulfovibrio sp.]|nr:5'-nucleotidase C-terminal domain-containing protein [Pseudodesulfovibrio sp.]